MTDVKKKKAIHIGIRYRDIYGFPEYIVTLGMHTVIHLSRQKMLDDIRNTFLSHKNDTVRLFVALPLTLTKDEGEYVSEGKLKGYYTWKIKPDGEKNKKNSKNT
jgi:hypothetical protein